MQLWLDCHWDNAKSVKGKGILYSVVTDTRILLGLYRRDKHLKKGLLQTTKSTQEASWSEDGQRKGAGGCALQIFALFS